MAVERGMIVKDRATAKNEASANTIYKTSYVTTVKFEDADGDSTEKFVVLKINENLFTPANAQPIEYVGEKNRRRCCLNARGQSINKRIDHGDKLKAIT
ncbi:hypothetical protein ARSEF1564_008672 [Beauveria bassiana]